MCNVRTCVFQFLRYFISKRSESVLNKILSLFNDIGRRTFYNEAYSKIGKYHYKKGVKFSMCPDFDCGNEDDSHMTAINCIYMNSD